MIESTLRLAIAEGYKVRIVYLKEKETQMRLLEPRILKDGLLTAKDLEKRQVRKFSVERILAASIVREEV